MPIKDTKKWKEIQHKAEGKRYETTLAKTVGRVMEMLDSHERIGNPIELIHLAAKELNAGRVNAATTENIVRMITQIHSKGADFQAAYTVALASGRQ